jgi:hypothetical protein
VANASCSSLPDLSDDEPLFVSFYKAQYRLLEQITSMFVLETGTVDRKQDAK